MTLTSHHPKAEHHGLMILDIDGEPFFRISDTHQMRPFLMTIVSPGNHWMFVGSNGGITAGRTNPEFTLFPYDTDDKVIESAVHTGNRTLIRTHINDSMQLWEPFAENGEEMFNIRRHVFKNGIGNKVIFEEENETLGLTFSYMWTFSEMFGFVKHAAFKTSEHFSGKVEILDGVTNLMPSGVPSQLQIQRSTLVDAYKRNELDQETGLGIFALSAIIVDKAEPSEALLATTAWTTASGVKQYLLSKNQISAFRLGKEIQTEKDVVGEKGSYLCLLHPQLAPGQTFTWYQVFEVNQSHADVENLRALLKAGNDLGQLLREDITRTTADLKQLVADSDGIQKTADVLSVSRHYMNVLFNIMRGGLFDENYSIPRNDYLKYIQASNVEVYQRQQPFFAHLSENICRNELIQKALESGDPDLLRLSLEYLPLFFSRRHGDPSRPWNYFSINTSDANGNKILNYEGNWRDIFQNWEALSYSYPEYIEGFIARFLNASTIDGYNPYRISKEGIDWETEEEDDPWSYIGYWGDHQVVYLLKLLELSLKFHPGALQQMLDTPSFVYANVPYRIKNHHDLVLDPRNTILFDHELERIIHQRTQKIGTDGKLVWDEDGTPIRATLAEKLLVSLSAKLCNFIPGAGIWMNTQRPEWNDANNALVGNGVSMVTLCYLRRHIDFLFSFLSESGVKELHLNRPVAQMIDGLERVFAEHMGLLAGRISEQERRSMMDDLGAIGEQYRTLAYSGFNGRVDVLPREKVLSLLDLALRFCDDTIRQNKRQDGLYHAYNLIDLKNGKASIRHLYEMLEGQVAVLSTGLLSPEESLSLLDSLKASNMYREDQYSYMLYPNRRLKGFLEKNFIPQDLAETCPLLEHLVEAGEHALVERDVNGVYHFSQAIHNENDVQQVLNTLAEQGWKDDINAYGSKVLEIFDTLFDHSAFTGRSGTFYGYEGLGSIYWHMVSKLLLAVQETIQRATEKGVSQETFGRLVEHYYEIRAGIGVNKSPELYGAFPTDPYSHTPINAGAQQPGMTGQVKEDVINRWAELGLHIQNGCLSFRPKILRKSEFLDHPEEFMYLNLNNESQVIQMPAGSLAFTICKVPVVYHLSDDESVELFLAQGDSVRFEGLEITKEWSKEIFQRTGKIEKIVVYCSPHL